MLSDGQGEQADPGAVLRVQLSTAEPHSDLEILSHTLVLLYSSGRRVQKKGKCSVCK